MKDGPHVKHKGTSEKYTFFCKGCKKYHHLSMYAVAQLASFNDVKHTCPESKHVQIISSETFREGFAP